MDRIETREFIWQSRSTTYERSRTIQSKYLQTIVTNTESKEKSKETNESIPIGSDSTRIKSIYNITYQKNSREYEQLLCQDQLRVVHFIHQSTKLTNPRTGWCFVKRSNLQQRTSWPPGTEIKLSLIILSFPAFFSFCVCYSFLLSHLFVFFCSTSSCFLSGHEHVCKHTSFLDGVDH